MSTCELLSDLVYAVIGGFIMEWLHLGLVLLRTMMKWGGCGEASIGPGVQLHLIMFSF